MSFDCSGWGRGSYYGRRIAALNDKNTIRPMKKGATKTKKKAMK